LAGFTPWKNRGNGHQEQQRQTEGHGHSIEEWLTDHYAAIVQSFNDERENCSEQNDKCENTEHHIVR